MEKQCIIISVFNDGVYDLALNHLTSLRNQNITNYMAFTTGAKTFADFKERGFNIKFLEANNLRAGKLEWNKQEFNKFNALRYELMKQALTTYKYVWYLDVDTVVLDDLNKYIPLTDTAFDCKLQDDISMPCTGCMLLKRTDQTLVLINMILKSLRQWKYQHNDQLCLRDVLSRYFGWASTPAELQASRQGRRGPKYTIKLKMFDRATYPNGLLFFDEESRGLHRDAPERAADKQHLAEKDKYEAIPNKSPAFVHANWMLGNEKKITAFKKYGLWFI